MFTAPIWNLTAALVTSPFLLFYKDDRLYVRAIFWLGFLIVSLSVLIAALEIYYDVPKLLGLPLFWRLVIAVWNIAIGFLFLYTFIAFFLPPYRKIFIVAIFVYSVIAPFSYILRILPIFILITVLVIYRKENSGPMLYLVIFLVLSTLSSVVFSIPGGEVLGMAILVSSGFISFLIYKSLSIKIVKIPFPTDYSIYVGNKLIIGEKSDSIKDISSLLNILDRYFEKDVDWTIVTIQNGNLISEKPVEEVVIRAALGLLRYDHIILYHDKRYIGCIKIENIEEMNRLRFLVLHCKEINIISFYIKGILELIK